ncbi:unnamed protein product [Nezara viridula]|uniref:Neuropeptide n=1 Tax=Nezara viridula TaxID=85310 RepID=A0A9P0MQP3_NEZVI|nr:unnamed protein product [Nezara viridula]
MAMKDHLSLIFLLVFIAAISGQPQNAEPLSNEDDWVQKEVHEVKQILEGEVDNVQQMFKVKIEEVGGKLRNFYQNHIGNSSAASDYFKKIVQQIPHPVHQVFQSLVDRGPQCRLLRSLKRLETARRFRLLQHLLDKRSKHPTIYKRLIYITIIRPIWTYGIELWGYTNHQILFHIYHMFLI